MTKILKKIQYFTLALLLVNWLSPNVLANDSVPDKQKDYDTSQLPPVVEKDTSQKAVDLENVPVPSQRSAAGKQFLYSRNTGNSTMLLYNPETLKQHSYIDNLGYLMEYLGVNPHDGNYVDVRFQGSIHAIQNSDVGKMISLSDIRSFPYYVKQNGILTHYIEANPYLDNSWYFSVQLGNAPTWMQEGQKYYSFSGIYFTDSPEKLGHYSQQQNAVNGNDPYYDYYLYQPLRTKTSYSAGELNQAFEYFYNQSSVRGKPTILRNQGATLLNAEAKFGTNALMVLALGIHEGAYGTSSIAISKNNTFGYAAYDSNTGAAKAFATPEEGINYVAGDYLSWVHGDPTTGSKYYGANFGNKGSGMNVKYASDPFWGEKNASMYARIDRYLGKKDYQKYGLSIVSQNTPVYWKNGGGQTAFNYRGSTSLLTYMYPVVTYNDSTWVQVGMEPPFDGNNNIDYHGRYNWQSRGYIHQDQLIKVNTTKNFEEFSNLEQFEMIDGTISVSGWHAASNISGTETSFLSLVDAETGQRYYNTSFQRLHRPDVEKAYPQFSEGLRSGFSLKIEVIDAMRGRPIKVVSRYSNEQDNEIYSNAVYSQILNIPATEVQGWLDEFTINGSDIYIRGWHSATNIRNDQLSEILVVNANTMEQYTRVPFSREAWPNVPKFYPQFKEGLYSGFNMTISLTEQMRGNPLKIISRYLDANGNTVSSERMYDTIKTAPVAEVKGWLDEFTISADNIYIRGWHSATNVKSDQRSFIIVVDAVTNEQYYRTSFQREAWPNVIKVFPQFKEGLHSGFEMNIPVVSKMVGKSLKIVSRYADETGNIVYSERMYETIKKTPTVEIKGWLDEFTISEDNIYIRGWHSATNVKQDQTSFIIVIDAITNEQYYRTSFQREAWPNVIKVFPQFKEGLYSGYDMTIPLTYQMQGRPLKIVSRYADTSGDVVYSEQMYETVKTAQVSEMKGWLDEFKIKEDNIYIRGWHSATNVKQNQTSYIRVVDALTNEQYYYSSFKRDAWPNVIKVFPQFKEGLYSGFEMSIPITDKMRGKPLNIISQYTDTNGDIVYSERRYEEIRIVSMG